MKTRPARSVTCHDPWKRRPTPPICPNTGATQWLRHLGILLGWAWGSTRGSGMPCWPPRPLRRDGDDAGASGRVPPLRGSGAQDPMVALRVRFPRAPCSSGPTRPRWTRSLPRSLHHRAPHPPASCSPQALPLPRGGRRRWPLSASTSVWRSQRNVPRVARWSISYRDL